MSATVMAATCPAAGKVRDCAQTHRPGDSGRTCRAPAASTNAASGSRVTIEIGPREAAHAERRRRAAERLPRAVAVVPQHDRRALADSQRRDRDRRPSRCRPARRRRSRRSETCRCTSRAVHVGERPVLVLQQQEQRTPAPPARKVGPEVVIPIERHDESRAGGGSLEPSLGGSGHEPGAPSMRRTLAEIRANERQVAVDVQRKRERDVVGLRGAGPIGSAVNVSAVSGADGVAGGDASTRNRSNGSAISSAGVRTAIRLSENAGTGASTFLRMRGGARRRRRSSPSPRGLLQRGELLSAPAGGHDGRIAAERIDRIAQPLRRPALRGQPRTLEQHRQIGWRAHRQLVEQRLRLARRPRRAGALTVPRPARSAPADRVRRAAPPGASRQRPRRGVLARFPCDRRAARGHVVGCERERPLDRLSGRVELAEPQLRQAKVGPRRRLARHELVARRELLPGIVEQPDLERGEAVIERARRLLVGRPGAGSAAGDDDTRRRRTTTAAATTTSRPPRAAI